MAPRRTPFDKDIHDWTGLGAAVAASVCLGVYASSWLVGIGVFCALWSMSTEIVRATNYVARGRK